MWKHGKEGHDEHKLWLTKWCWFGSIYHVMHIHLPSSPPPIIGHYGAKVSLKLHYNFLQLNLYQTDLLFWYLSHHLTWHCSSISEYLHRFARNLQHLLAKLFLLLFLNSFRRATTTKTILHSHMCKSVQIFINPETMQCQMMA